MGSCKQKNNVMNKSFRTVTILCLLLIFVVRFNADAQSRFLFSEYNQGVEHSGNRKPVNFYQGQVKPAEEQSVFRFTEEVQGIELFENGQPVYFYQRQPKSVDGRYICSNYLHPLFSLGGDTLTEEFPEDHPYHRGVFWAWHQIFIDNNSVGDGWVMEHISEEVTGVHPEVSDNLAVLNLDVQWKSDIFQDGKAFVQENTAIVVHPLKAGVRIIDFEIKLTAMVPGISIGGSDDEKGYGGFCIRMKLPDDLIFTSTNGPVEPQTMQIKAGTWMDFSGSFCKNNKKSGITILSQRDFLNYPVHWILRRETSMQNIVFPGRQRANLSVDKPIILKYRVIVHNGNARKSSINKQQREYSRYSYPISGQQIN